MHRKHWTTLTNCRYFNSLGKALNTLFRSLQYGFWSDLFGDSCTTIVHKVFQFSLSLWVGKLMTKKYETCISLAWFSSKQVFNRIDKHILIHLERFVVSHNSYLLFHYHYLSILWCAIFCVFFAAQARHSHATFIFLPLFNCSTVRLFAVRSVCLGYFSVSVREFSPFYSSRIFQSFWHGFTVMHLFCSAQ